MTKIVATALVASIMIAACAINARAAVSENGTAAPATYYEALKACSAKWKGTDERKAAPIGEGAAAWQTFRAMCVKESGYISARGKKPR